MVDVPPKDYKEMYDRHYACSIKDYLRHINNYMRMERIRRIQSFVNGESVLEVGCGIGPALSIVKGRRVGLDVSHRVLRVAKRLWPEIEFVVGSACDLPFREETFDCAISSEVIEHLDPSDAVRSLREVSRTLRPNGRVVVTTPNRTSLWNSSFLTRLSRGFGTYHLALYSVAEVMQLLPNEIIPESVQYGSEVEFGPRFHPLIRPATSLSLILGSLGLTHLLNSRIYCIGRKALSLDRASQEGLKLASSTGISEAKTNLSVCQFVFLSSVDQAFSKLKWRCGRE